MTMRPPTTATVISLLSALTLACAGEDATPPPLDAGTADAAYDGAAPPADSGLDGGDAGPASWTFIVVPDTQIVAQDFREIFDAQARWIVAQRAALNLQFVLHVGDIVDDDVSSQWEVAFDALHMLDGVVPYVLTPGNHDYYGIAATRDTMLNAYFPVSDYESLPTFGGVYEEGKINNSYHVFETPTGPWLVVALEFGPRDLTIPWAAEVVSRYPGLRAVLVTHAYLYSDDTRYDWATYGTAQMWNPHAYGIESDPEGVNDGEELWTGLVRDHDDIDLVVCGHVLNDGLGRLESTQAGGGTVQQILANYQFEKLGGAGFMRIMSVDPDGRTIHVRTYSPYLDEYRTDPDNEFTTLLEPR